MKLKVSSARVDDVLEDIVRVNEAHRVDGRGRLIPTGAVCSITIGRKRVYAVARGTADDDVICMDDALRERLGVRLGEIVEPSFKKAGLVGEQVWGWRAGHPTTRAAARLGIISLALGVIGLVLGFISLAPAVTSRAAPTGEASAVSSHE